ncbi:hypothetical protein CLV35_2695 [Motilibacter peucedani]|uniref:Integral membrane protein n=1 Tax=Motilibacter peucedani TaxID=598650 RepID=A0A420XM42_9ACTN|nr:hypothetical protein [Motilibacter peucedani]RKS72451.1 hypothetical protein CLV35_2695 [Motilibacter peucedani]
MAALVAVAATAYACNVLLGVLVQRRLVDTSGVRWLHHALFFAVAASATAAVGAALLTRTWPALLLAPALGAWLVMPRLPGGTTRHRATALGVMPFYALALVLVL